jgi:hypothetical protein
MTNAKYLNYSFNFSPLNDNEIIDYSFERFRIDDQDYSLKLYALNIKNMTKRVIGFWNVKYGSYQFSVDRKSCVFYISSKARYNSVFLVNGIDGLVYYLLDVNIPMMTSGDLNFLLFRKYNTESTQKMEFILVNLRDFNAISIDLNINFRPGGGIRIFRGINNEYDFRIEYHVESSLYGVYTYTINNNNLKIIFDDTDLLEERFLPRGDILPEELGLY